MKVRVLALAISLSTFVVAHLRVLEVNAARAGSARGFAAVGSDTSINVVPFEFDPNNTNLAKATWLSGTGCAPSGGTDPTCAVGADPKDKKNEGLLFVKTGRTANLGCRGCALSMVVKGVPSVDTS